MLLFTCQLLLVALYMTTGHDYIEQEKQNKTKKPTSYNLYFLSQRAGSYS